MRRQLPLTLLIPLVVSCGHSGAASTKTSVPLLACSTKTTTDAASARLPVTIRANAVGYRPMFLVLVTSKDAVAEVLRLTDTRKSSTDAAWAASYEGLAVVESAAKSESDVDGCALAKLVQLVPEAIVIDLRIDSRPTIVADP